LPSDAPKGICPFCLLDGPESQPWESLDATATFRSPGATRPDDPAARKGAEATGEVDLGQFIESLIDVRLMDRCDVESFLERMPSARRPKGAADLARELVRVGRLTGYQAGALLCAKSRGLSLGNYLIMDRIGKGGMGIVFKAQHRRMKRVVALKVLPPSFATSEGAVLRFLREAEAVAKLEHPNIVAAFDADEFHGVHFFAMEYVDGIDLARLIETQGPLPVQEALACVMQSAAGLGAAHAKGIYHRDIKPSNLIRDRSGTVKLLDLGLARMMSGPAVFAQAEPAAMLSRPGDLKGTVSFMPPEQAYNSSEADHRSDIYSLGCTLYFLLIGKPPYAGVTAMACLVAHREAPIPSLRAIRPDVPVRLDETLRRMMAKAPEDRYPSIVALMADLETCRADLAKGEGDSCPTVLEVAPDPATAPSDLCTPEPPRARVRTYVALLIVTLLVLAVAGLAANRGLNRSHEASTSAPIPPAPPPRGPQTKPWWAPRAEAAGPVVAEPILEPVEGVGVVRTLRNGLGMVEAVAVSADGGYALSGGNDGMARLWSLKAGRAVFDFPHDGPVFDVAISPDGTRGLTAGGEKRLRLWNLETGKEIRHFDGHEKKVNSVAFSPGGGRLASASDDGTIRVWDTETRAQVALAHQEKRVNALAFAGPDRLLSAVGDKTLRVLATADASEITRFTERAEAFCLAVSPDGRLALWGGDGGRLTVCSLDSPSPSASRFLEGGPRDWVRCVAFLPDNRHAIAGHEGGRLLIWDVAEGRIVHTFEDASQGRLGLAIPDGTHALTSDADGRLRIWRLPPLGPQGDDGRSP
jgi:serine/threonine protein kinase